MNGNDALISQGNIKSYLISLTSTHRSAVVAFIALLEAKLQT